MNKAEYLEKTVDMISSYDCTELEKVTMNRILELVTKNNKNMDITNNDSIEAFVEAIHNDATTDSKNLRRLLGLPITKELVYMERDASGFTPYRVVSYQVVEWYNESNASLEVALANGNSFRILGDYFSHMQKPSFEKDMVADSLSVK